MPSLSPPAALVGLAIDVSGSMQSNIRNRDGTAETRFGSFQGALLQVVHEGQQRAGELAASGTPESEALIFAYAFGLSVSPDVVDLFALLAAADNVTSPAEIEQFKRRYAEEMRQRYAGYGELADLARSFGFGRVVDDVAARARTSAEEEVRARIKETIMGRVRSRLASQQTLTLTLTELARSFAAGSASFGEAEQFIFGGTPMRQCLEQVADRFAAETAKLPPATHKFLVLVSDGEPTDGDPRPALQRIRAQGVFVASCLVTDANVTASRRLYAQPREEWSGAAKLMFEAASAVEDDDLYLELLESQGWKLERKARLFTQINHSDMMNEFLKLALGRVRCL